MTPERIAEFRDAIANHPHFGIGGDALSKILDALEAAQQEIAVDAGRLRDAAMRVWGEDAHGCDTPDRLADAILGLRAQIADLKRGGVVVGREEFDLLRKIEGMWLPPFGVPHNPESIALFDALRALRALRAQLAQESTP